MLLTLTTTRPPATDLGYLLHKHPDRVQRFDLSFGAAEVFYPEASAGRCTAALLLDVDAVGLSRGRDAWAEGYVNDRPFVASSLMSVALSQVFGTAMAGRCKDRPELAATPLPLTARIDVLPVRGGPAFLDRLFAPLGYDIAAERRALDDAFPDWGEGPYHSVTLTAETALSRLLSHLYVLIPVFDDDKHYYVGDAEVEKLLAKGGDWLAAHPERSAIARRYLKRRSGLVRRAVDRLAESGPPVGAEGAREGKLEKPLSLHQHRLGAVAAALRSAGAATVLDLGCGEGRLLSELAGDKRFTRIVGVDVSPRALGRARGRVKSGRVELLHGSLLYRDRRLAGFDAAALVEVIEHFDPPRLAALERNVFGSARPKCVAVTTPNREYNAVWEELPAGQFRHPDHRFEWTRAEFRAWADRVAGEFGYAVRLLPAGPEHEEYGPPTQMAVFSRTE